MDVTRPYPNAPITEAIIDLRASFASEVPLDALQRIGAATKVDYPQRQQLFEAVGQMAVGPGGGSAAVNQKAIGYTFKSSNAKQIFQSRVNGFTFSRLAPYDSWAPFRNEARRLWDLYRENTQPEQITRLAVRYINRIDIPAQQVELKEYFRTSPEIAEELPQTLDGFFMQLRIPVSAIEGTAVINQTIVPPPSEDVVSVVLDIDMFRSEAISQTEDEVWTFFETLHELKNTFFESCITDSARRLFQ